MAPLYYMAHNPELSLLPSGQMMGTVLDPCTHIRQKPWEHRASGFRALSFGNEAEPYVPDHARLTDDELWTLATAPIDAQRAAGATLLLTTYHVAGAVGTRGRAIELLLAATGVAHFRQEVMSEPPPFAAVNVPREIYATIAIRVGDLKSPATRRALVEAYLAVDADGFWVKIEGLHERASRAAITAAGAFLGALRAGGRPIVSDCPGQLHLALLADDISASIGLGESERFVLPATWSMKVKKGQGRTRMAYHPKYHRSFRVKSQDAVRAFRQAPCECELHPPRIPPDGLVVAQHAAILRASQANEALEGDRAERREWLLASSTKASWATADAEIAQSGSTSALYESLFAGLDAGDDVAATGEQTDF